MREIKAIQTRYKGCHFRSRLEARWAVYLDAIGCKWQYEPEGFHLPDGTLYLPDFWLSSVNMWAEVKSAWPTDEEIQKAVLLAQGTGHEVLFLDGSPRNVNYWSVSETANLEEDDGWGNYLLTNYYITCKKERRFFSFWGGESHERAFNRPDQTLECDESVLDAVEAALSARFEHGESGRT